MRIFLVLLLQLSFYYQSQACLSAHQNRIFPLGMEGNRLIVFETNLERGSFSKVSEFELWWMGKTYLRTYNEKGQMIESKVMDTLKFKGSEYTQKINTSFLKALKKAKAIPGFVVAQPVSIYFYDYSDAYKNIKIVNDTVKEITNIKIDSKLYPVTVLKDTNSIARDFLKYYSRFNSGHIPDVYFNSIRKFKIGNKTLTLFHLGNGQTFENADGTYDKPKPYAANFSFTKIEETVFDEPVLHHGHGFDFVILE